jgi:hypothetical protein
MRFELRLEIDVNEKLTSKSWLVKGAFSWLQSNIPSYRIIDDLKLNSRYDTLQQGSSDA